MPHSSAVKKMTWPVKSALGLAVASLCSALVNAQTLDPVVVSASRAETSDLAYDVFVPTTWTGIKIC